ncbi:hypothetical protein GCM10010207_81050 [Streptomyces atratus]|nr:hypothetical protein GCM10010207_81050 [Streptomyces atratus]
MCSGVCARAQAHTGQVQCSRRRESLRLADGDMGGAAGPEGVHGPREHTGPPCLREDLPDGHPIEVVVAGV